MLGDSHHRHIIGEDTVSGLTAVTSARLGLPFGRRDHRCMSPAQGFRLAFRRDLQDARIRWIAFVREAVQRTVKSSCATATIPNHAAINRKIRRLRC
jgi:hypothetical protein